MPCSGKQQKHFEYTYRRGCFPRLRVGKYTSVFLNGLLQRRGRDNDYVIKRGILQFVPGVLKANDLVAVFYND